SRPPGYSVSRLNDGLWTRSGSMPRPRASPRTRQVLPAPSSPTRPISSPPRAARPSASPSASVSSGVWVVTSRTRTVASPARRLGAGRRLQALEGHGQLGEEVAREEARLALPRRDRVAGRAVREHAERRRL